MLKFLEITKTLLLVEAGEFSANCGTVTINTDKFTANISEMKLTEENSSSVIDWRTRIDFNFEEDNALRIKLTNTSAEPIYVKDIVVDFAPSSFASKRMSREHTHILNDLSCRAATGIKRLNESEPWADVNQESSIYMLFSNTITNAALVIGALPPFGSSYTWISPIHESSHAEGAFGIRIRFEFKQTVAPGNSISTAPIVALYDNDSARELLQHYAGMSRTRNTLELKPKAKGWNSWDYYLGSVRRSDMDDNVEACEKQFANSVKYMIIDEGYEKATGEWDAGWKFQEGLKDHCDNIISKGYTPGIWTAPLLMSVSHPMFRYHPECFVKDANGGPYISSQFGSVAHLDITHPDAENYIRESFTKLKEYGFSYFKCDFIKQIIDGVGFYNSEVGRAHIPRLLFKAIRESIGDDSYLLCCDAPLESVVGIVDGFRASIDIHDYWSHVTQNARINLTRMWMNGPYGNLDPDFLFVRCPETSDDPVMNPFSAVIPIQNGIHWCDGAHWTLEEAKTWALLAYMIGGEIILSDAIHKLNELGIDILRRTLARPPKWSEHLNLFDPDGTHAPILLAATGADFVLAFFNLTEEPLTRNYEMRFVEGKRDAMEFWTDEDMVLEKTVEVVLPPRSSKAFRILP